MPTLLKSPPRRFDPNNVGGCCPVCGDIFEGCKHTVEEADAMIAKANAVLLEDDIRRFVAMAYPVTQIRMHPFGYQVGRKRKDA